MKGAPQVHQEKVDGLDHQAQMDCLVHQVYLVKEDQLDTQVLQVKQDSVDLLAILGKGDLQVKEESQGHQVSKAHLETLALQVLLDPLDPQVCLENQVNLEHQEQEEKLVQQDL